MVQNSKCIKKSAVNIPSTHHALIISVSSHRLALWLVSCVSIHGCSSHAHLYSLFISVSSWLRRVFTAVLELSQVAASGALPHHDVWASPCGGLAVGAQASGARALIVAAHGLGSCGSGTCLLRGMRNLPRPEIESPSPACTGGFVSPGPPGKSSSFSLHSQTICVIHTITHFAFLT